MPPLVFKEIIDRGVLGGDAGLVVRLALVVAAVAVADEIARGLGARFVSGEVDAVYVVYNEFRSVISQIVRTKRLLPVSLEAGAGAPGAGGTDYLYEPGNGGV